MEPTKTIWKVILTHLILVAMGSPSTSQQSDVIHYNSSSRMSTAAEPRFLNLFKFPSFNFNPFQLGYPRNNKYKRPKHKPNESYTSQDSSPHYQEHQDIQHVNPYKHRPHPNSKGHKGQKGHTGQSHSPHSSHSLSKGHHSSGQNQGSKYKINDKGHRHGIKVSYHNPHQQKNLHHPKHPHKETITIHSSNHDSKFTNSHGINDHKNPFTYHKQPPNNHVHTRLKGPHQTTHTSIRHSPHSNHKTPDKGFKHNSKGLHHKHHLKNSQDHFNNPHKNTYTVHTSNNNNNNGFTHIHDYKTSDNGQKEEHALGYGPPKGEDTIAFGYDTEHNNGNKEHPFMAPHYHIHNLKPHEETKPNYRAPKDIVKVNSFNEIRNQKKESQPNIFIHHEPYISNILEEYKDGYGPPKGKDTINVYSHSSIRDEKEIKTAIEQDHQPINSFTNEDHNFGHGPPKEKDTIYVDSHRSIRKEKQRKPVVVSDDQPITTFINEDHDFGYGPPKGKDNFDVDSDTILRNVKEIKTTVIPNHETLSLSKEEHNLGFGPPKEKDTIYVNSNNARKNEKENNPVFMLNHQPRRDEKNTKINKPSHSQHNFDAQDENNFKHKPSKSIFTTHTDPATLDSTIKDEIQKDDFTSVFDFPDTSYVSYGSGIGGSRPSHGLTESGYKNPFDIKSYLTVPEVNFKVKTNESKDNTLTTLNHQTEVIPPNLNKEIIHVKNSQKVLSSITNDIKFPEYIPHPEEKLKLDGSPKELNRQNKYQEQLVWQQTNRDASEINDEHIENVQPNSKYSISNVESDSVAKNKFTVGINSDPQPQRVKNLNPLYNSNTNYKPPPISAKPNFDSVPIYKGPNKIKVLDYRLQNRKEIKNPKDSGKNANYVPLHDEDSAEASDEFGLAETQLYGQEEVKTLFDSQEYPYPSIYRPPSSFQNFRMQEMDETKNIPKLRPEEKSSSRSIQNDFESNRTNNNRLPGNQVLLQSYDYGKKSPEYTPQITSTNETLMQENKSLNDSASPILISQQYPKNVTSDFIQFRPSPKDSNMAQADMSNFKPSQIVKLELRNKFQTQNSNFNDGGVPEFKDLQDFKSPFFKNIFTNDGWMRPANKASL